MYTRPPVEKPPNYTGDSSLDALPVEEVIVYPKMGDQGPISPRERVNNSVSKAFTWNDAREIAILVRDSLLMLIKGLERKFDISKK
jgi:hypothetical protein